MLLGSNKKLKKNILASVVAPIWSLQAIAFDSVFSSATDSLIVPMEQLLPLVILSRSIDPYSTGSLKLDPETTATFSDMEPPPLADAIPEYFRMQADPGFLEQIRPHLEQLGWDLFMSAGPAMAGIVIEYLTNSESVGDTSERVIDGVGDALTSANLQEFLWQFVKSNYSLGAGPISFAAFNLSLLQQAGNDVVNAFSELSGKHQVRMTSSFLARYLNITIEFPGRIQLEFRDRWHQKPNLLTPELRSIMALHQAAVAMGVRKISLFTGTRASGELVANMKLHSARQRFPVFGLTGQFGHNDTHIWLEEVLRKRQLANHDDLDGHLLNMKLKSEIFGVNERVIVNPLCDEMLDYIRKHLEALKALPDWSPLLPEFATVVNEQDRWLYSSQPDPNFNFDFERDYDHSLLVGSAGRLAESNPIHSRLFMSASGNFIVDLFETGYESYFWSPGLKVSEQDLRQLDRHRYDHSWGWAVPLGGFSSAGNSLLRRYAINTMIRGMHRAAKSIIKRREQLKTSSSETNGQNIQEFVQKVEALEELTESEEPADLKEKRREQLKTPSLETNGQNIQAFVQKVEPLEELTESEELADLKNLAVASGEPNYDGDDSSSSDSDTDSGFQDIKAGPRHKVKRTRGQRNRPHTPLSGGDIPVIKNADKEQSKGSSSPSQGEYTQESFSDKPGPSKGSGTGGGNGGVGNGNGGPDKDRDSESDKGSGNGTNEEPSSASENSDTSDQEPDDRILRETFSGSEHGDISDHDITIAKTQSASRQSSTSNVSQKSPAIKPKSTKTQARREELGKEARRKQEQQPMTVYGHGLTQGVSMPQAEYSEKVLKTGARKTLIDAEHDFTSRDERHQGELSKARLESSEQKEKATSQLSPSMARIPLTTTFARKFNDSRKKQISRSSRSLSSSPYPTRRPVSSTSYSHAKYREDDQISVISELSSQSIPFGIGISREGSPDPGTDNMMTDQRLLALEITVGQLQQDMQQTVQKTHQHSEQLAYLEQVVVDTNVKEPLESLSQKILPPSQTEPSMLAEPDENLRQKKQLLAEAKQKMKSGKNVLTRLYHRRKNRKTVSALSKDVRLLQYEKKIDERVSQVAETVSRGVVSEQLSPAMGELRHGLAHFTESVTGSVPGSLLSGSQSRLQDFSDSESVVFTTESPVITARLADLTEGQKKQAMDWQNLHREVQLLRSEQEKLEATVSKQDKRHEESWKQLQADMEKKHLAQKERSTSITARLEATGTSLSEHGERLDDLKGNQKKLRADHDATREKVTSYSATLEGLSQKQTTFEQSQADHRASLNHEFKQRDESFEELKTEFEQNRETVLQHSDQLGSLESRQRKTEEAHGETRSELTSHSADLEAITTWKSSHQQDWEKHQTDLTEQLERNDDTVHKLTAKTEELEATVNEQDKRHEESLNRLQTDMDKRHLAQEERSTSITTRLEATGTSLSEHGERLDDLEDSQEKLRADHDATHAKVTGHDSTLEDFSQKQTALEQSQADQRTFMDDGFQQRDKSFEELKTEFEQNRETVLQHCDQLGSLESRQRKTEEAHGETRSELTSHSADLEAITSWKNSHQQDWEKHQTDLTEQLERNDDTVHKLTTKTEELEATVNEQDKRHKESLNRLQTDMDKRHLAQEERSTSITTRLEATGTSLSEHGERLDDLKDNQEKLRADHDATHAKVTGHSSTLEDFSQKQTALEQSQADQRAFMDHEFQQRDKSLEDVKAGLEKDRAIVLQHGDQLGSLESSQRELEEAHGKTRSELTTVSGSLAKVSAWQDSLQQSWNEHQSDFREQLQELYEKTYELSKEVADHRQKLTGQDGRLTGLESSHQTLSSTQDKTQKEMESHTETLAILSQQQEKFKQGLSGQKSQMEQLLQKVTESIKKPLDKELNAARKSISSQGEKQQCHEDKLETLTREQEGIGGLARKNREGISRQNKLLEQQGEKQRELEQGQVSLRSAVTSQSEELTTLKEKHQQMEDTLTARELANSAHFDSQAEKVRIKEIVAEELDHHNRQLEQRLMEQSTNQEQERSESERQHQLFVESITKIAFDSEESVKALTTRMDAQEQQKLDTRKFDPWRVEMEAQLKEKFGTLEKLQKDQQEMEDRHKANLKVMEDEIQKLASQLAVSRQAELAGERKQENLLNLLNQKTDEKQQLENQLDQFVQKVEGMDLQTRYYVTRREAVGVTAASTVILLTVGYYYADYFTSEVLKLATWMIETSGTGDYSLTPKSSTE